MNDRKIIDIKGYLREKQLQEDYLEELQHYIGLLTFHSNKLHNLRQRHFGFFLRKHIKNLESEIDNDKAMITMFTRLYNGEKNVDIRKEKIYN